MWIWNIWCSFFRNTWWWPREHTPRCWDILPHSKRGLGGSGEWNAWKGGGDDSDGDDGDDGDGTDVDGEDGDDGDGNVVDGDDGDDFNDNHDDDDTLAKRGKEPLKKETKNGSKIKGTGLQAVLSLVRLESFLTLRAVCEESIYIQTFHPATVRAMKRHLFFQMSQYCGCSEI